MKWFHQGVLYLLASWICAKDSLIRVNTKKLSSLLFSHLPPGQVCVFVWEGGMGCRSGKWWQIVKKKKRLLLLFMSSLLNLCLRLTSYLKSRRVSSISNHPGYSHYVNFLSVWVCDYTTRTNKKAQSKRKLGMLKELTWKTSSIFI